MGFNITSWCPGIFNPKQSIKWFAAYLSLVVIAFLVNDKIAIVFYWELSEDFINRVFPLNIIAISFLIFAIQYHFFGNQTILKKDIEVKSVELNEQSEKLKELDKAKSRFFANISHEFRTPLTLILGLINRQITHPDHPPKQEDTVAMKRNANRLLQLINQLLDLSKLESGEIHLEASKDDILDFTKKITLLYESLARDKEIKFSFNKHLITSDHKHDEIHASFDKEKLQKILTNLISNAIKLTPNKGVIDIEVNRRNATVDFEYDHVNICISNSGDGIPKDKLPYVFDRFYQVDAASTRQYEGTGIGLALVKELVELHHGNVITESESGETTFTICLPLGNQLFTESELDESSPIPVEHQKPIVDLKMNTHEVEAIDTIKSNNCVARSEDHLEILIVEDNPDLRTFIVEILDDHYKVIQAVDGIDGLEKAETYIPDLIISDVMMPRMNGYELCKQLKTNKNTNHIPVILLTAKASRENKIEGLETGADDYLIKPFDQESLLVRIKNLIAIREELQMKYQQEVWLKPKEMKVSSVHQKFLERIKEITEKQIDNHQFSVEDLGKEIGMSRSQVHRKLKALTNQSATNFIRDCRLHRAADLLKQEVGNVTEIAYQVGFSSQTYYSSCFQELFACTPSEYKSKVN